MKTANFARSAIIETYGRFPFVTSEDDWLISIANKDSYNAVPKAKFNRVLFLNFQDIELNTPGGVETEKSRKWLAEHGAITEPQAEQIADFIKEARDQGKNVWVNCHAGMCRSGAIVRLLTELGWEDERYQGQPDRVPNLLVYNRVKRHFPELHQSWDYSVATTHASMMNVGDMIGKEGAFAEILAIGGGNITIKWDYNSAEETLEQQSMQDFTWYGSPK